MKKRLLPILLILILILSSCGKQGAGTNGETLSVYRPVKEEYRTGGELLRAEKISLDENADPLQAAVYAISAQPGSDELMPSLPDGVEIVSAELVGNIAKVTMNSAYLSCQGIDKTITDYCIALTICSISQIDYVSTYVGADMIESCLTAGDAVLENNLTSTEEVAVRVYYPLSGGDGLGYEYHTITLSDDSIPERLVMEELLNGPESTQLGDALPKDTVLLSVYMSGDVCSVSFADGFLSGDDLTDDQIRLAVYSIVDSLTSLTEVTSVQILIEGKQAGYLGDVDVSGPLKKTSNMSGFAVVE